MPAKYKLYNYRRNGLRTSLRLLETELDAMDLVCRLKGNISRQTFITEALDELEDSDLKNDSAKLRHAICATLQRTIEDLRRVVPTQHRLKIFIDERHDAKVGAD